MSDNLGNVNKQQYTCKPGNGHTNNTDAVCVVNNESNPVLYNSNLLGNKGQLLTNCCNKVVNNSNVVESEQHLSKKCKMEHS